MTPKHIIIHHTAHPQDVPISTIRDWHVNGNGWKDVGYHYYIRKSGEIEVGRMENETGAHCKAQGMNRKSIGICLSGNFVNSYPTPEQMDSLNRLVGSIRARYEIESVLGHSDVASTQCPGFKVKGLI